MVGGKNPNESAQVTQARVRVLGFVFVWLCVSARNTLGQCDGGIGVKLMGQITTSGQPVSTIQGLDMCGYRRVCTKPFSE